MALLCKKKKILNDLLLFSTLPIRTEVTKNNTTSIRRFSKEQPSIQTQRQQTKKKKEKISQLL